jgi:5'-3' exonuclease
LKTLRAMMGLNEFTVKDVVVIWDGRPRGLSPRRVAMYPKYKVHDPGPEPVDAEKRIRYYEDIQSSERHRSLLEEQRPKLHRILSLLGVPSVNIPYREGDDIIACAARSLPGRLLVISDDKDYYQLVSDRISVYRAGVKDPYLVHLHDFEQKVGVKSPSQYLLSAAISGDGSDSIDGIPGVGGTTAERVANAAVFDGWVSYAVIDKAARELQISDSRNRKRYVKVLENMNIVTRNLQLMDLRLENWDNVEAATFWGEFLQPREVRERDVIAMFSSWEFRSYLSDFSNWVLPFKKLCRYEEAAA